MVSSSRESEQKRTRGMHSLMGPNDMSDFDRHQMCMDVISWILYGEASREFHEALHWLADFLKYHLGFTTQEEEDWFDTECNRFYVDLIGNRRNSNFFGCSKALSGVLRHCRKAYLFSPSGSMNISDLLDQLEGNNPKQYGLSGAQFAALLLCSNNQRFFVDIFIQWTWYPFSAAATYPFDVRLGCLQGHSNQASDPFTVHHPLTYDEAMCLGWIFHVTDWKNTTSINRSGLKTDAKGTGKGARDAIHFMYQNDNGQGFIRMAEGTTPPRHYYYPACYVLDPKFIESQQLFLTKNGVVLLFGDFIPAEYLHLQEQLPTLACPVLRPGRGHMLPPSATGGTWPADVSYGHVRREKGVGFVAGGEVPQTVRTTAWQFMGQEIPPNSGKLVFGFPLQTEVDFDPTIESVHGLAAGSSLQREEPAPKSPPMQNPYEQPSRRTGRPSQQEEPGQEGSSPHREEPDSQWEQQRSSSGSSEPPDLEDHPVDEQSDQEATSTNVQDDSMG